MLDIKRCLDRLLSRIITKPLLIFKLSNTIVENSKSNLLYRELDELASKYYLTYGKATKGVIQLDNKKYRELKSAELKILARYPKLYYSLIGLYKMFFDLNVDFSELVNVYEHLDDGIKSSSLGKEFFQRIASKKSIQMGQKFRGFTIKDERDSLFSTNTLSGKVYMVAFGTTWCLPCKQNYPKLKKIYEKYKNEGFEIVSVNLDANKNLWQQQIVQYKQSWINVSELKEWSNSDIAHLFNITAIPFYLLINKEGTIMYNSFELHDFDCKQLEKYIQAELD